MSRRSFAWVLAFAAFACGGSTTPVPDSTTSGSGSGSSGGGGSSGSGSGSSASSSGGVQGCTTEAMICPDGKTAVGRTGPNCTFAPCPESDAGPPATCAALAEKAHETIDGVLKSNASCNSPDECTQVPYATDCFSSCTRPMNKKGIDKLAAAKADLNANECKAFKGQGCTFAIPPCVAPPPPQCVDHQCQ